MKRTIAGILLTITLAGGLMSASCARKATKASESGAEEKPLLLFTPSADSLYSFVELQTTLGPRNPGSDAHRRCGDMIVERLKSYGIDSVAQQLAPVSTYDGKTFTARNILGCINPDAKNRVLLLAHYDTRPIADQDPDPRQRKTPIDGANDGASGVAILLEMARLAPAALPDSLGLDLLFTDMEDSGQSGYGDTEATWCLGTQKWIEELPYGNDNLPRLGILLDMVGGRDATFHRESFSVTYAPRETNRIWDNARRLGLQNRFVNEAGAPIVDDHIYVNRAGIPCVDIIECRNPQTNSFNPTWHTTADRLEAIDRNTMAAVAKVVVASITE